MSNLVKAALSVGTQISVLTRGAQDLNAAASPGTMSGAGGAKALGAAPPLAIVVLSDATVVVSVLTWVPSAAMAGSRDVVAAPSFAAAAGFAPLGMMSESEFSMKSAPA
jgi:hypothetical protein